jgi:acyl transferase domain-containing protein
MTVSSRPDVAASTIEPAEPVAVIGIACRLPGAATPEAFWQMLCDGTSSIAEVPADRARFGWPDDPPLQAGLLTDIADFDPGFFGISPREATMMDPQQRLILELSWEAFEDAGLTTATVRGTDLPVFIGVSSDDYAHLAMRGGVPAVTAHTMTGLNRSIIANRVSYFYDLHGPSLTVDTGQSSSLMAVHLAAEALARGTATTALAGGVSLAILGETTAAAVRFGGLSPDSRCYTFDERANGYVRGEGAGVVVLKRLGAATADGDRIYCVVRGGAANSDGATRTLTTPNPAAQQAVLRRAYQRAGIDPADVQYVELHGTGTPTGDPIEAAALGATLGRARPPDAPLLVGSAKTNIGHLEAAAGIAGLVKVALSISNGRIPASLNFHRPNPRIALNQLGLAVVAQTRSWPRPDVPLVAGISGFGMGGTNCHLVLSSVPPPNTSGLDITTPGTSNSPIVALAVSAGSASSLRGSAARLSDQLTANRAVSIEDVAYSLATTRSPLDHRAVVVAADRSGVLDGLAAAAHGQPAVNTVHGLVETAGGIVMVFSGQGSQWPGMAIELIDTSPEFAHQMRVCEQALAPYVGWNLTDVLRAVPGAPPLDRVDVVQPALFAIMVSIATLWRHHGVIPDAVVGHSQGEIAAACAAGALSLDDAARVVAVRSRAVATIAGTGGMVSVALASADVRRRLPTGVEIAAVNGPHTTIVAGGVADLAEFIAGCDVDGIRTRTVTVDYAAHSSHIDHVREQVRDGLTGLRPRSTKTAFYSSVTGGPIDTAGLDGSYWYRNLRQQVQFESTTRSLLTDCHRFFIEISPHPVLTSSIEDTIDDATAAGDITDHALILQSLRRDDGGRTRFLLSLAQAYVGGVPVDWRATCPPHARRIPLPAYPFQRQPYWIESTGAVSQPHSTMVRAGDRPPEPPDARIADLVARTDADQARDLLDLVCAHTAAVLGVRDLDEVRPGRAFTHLGLDSSAAVDLRRRLNAATGLTLSATSPFDHPTPAAMARYIQQQLIGDVPRQQPVMAGLDRLAESIDRMPADDPSLRRQVTTRLYELINRIVVAEDPDDATQQIPSATVEELFDLIDRGVDDDWRNYSRGGHE